MFSSTSSKVHPEVASSSSSRPPAEQDDDVLVIDGPSTSQSSRLPAPPKVEKVVARSSKLAGQKRRLLEWDEIVEDLDLAIENTKSKSHNYRYDGLPLKRSMPMAKIDLMHVTEEIMNSYGLEFLGIVSEVLWLGESQKITLPEILNQLQSLQYKKDAVGGEKLIIWVDDEPQEDEDGVIASKANSFSHLLLTELLRVKVEPEIVLPCHDFDEDVLVSLVQQVRKVLSMEQRLSYGADQVEFAKVVILQLLRIGLSVALAAAASKIILIDADSFVQEDPQIKLLMDMATQNGHTVMFFRNTAAVKDKAKEVEIFTEKVRAWHEASKKLDTTDPTNFMKVEMTEDVDEIELKRQKDAEIAKALIEQDLGYYYSKASFFRFNKGRKEENKQILKESNAIKPETKLESDKQQQQNEEEE